MHPTIYGSPDEAVAGFPDGSSVLLAGFGSASFAWTLFRALYDQDAKDLTLISNGVGLPGDPESGVKGATDFILDGRVRKVIATFNRPRSGPLQQMIRDGHLVAELTPQGTLAERIRAGGSGIPAFYTPTGVGTPIAEGKEIRRFKGRGYLLEEAITADFAFVHAWKADTEGNLLFRLASRNFNPIMAMAADCTIVEVDEPIVPAGELDPDSIHLPGIYVHRMIHIPRDGKVSYQWWVPQEVRDARAARATEGRGAQ